MPNMRLRVGGNRRKADLRIANFAPIPGSNLASARILRIKMRELFEEKRRLHLVEARIHAFVLVHVLLFRPIIPQGPYHAGKFSIVGHDHAGITEGTQVLRRVKAVSAGSATRRSRALKNRTVSLRAILENEKSAFFRNVQMADISARRPYR